MKVLDKKQGTEVSSDMKRKFKTLFLFLYECSIKLPNSYIISLSTTLYLIVDNVQLGIWSIYTKISNFVTT